jgi:hypothetical protein
MLEYQMMIVEKVSFDRSLFEKELRKSVAILNTNDTIELRNWAWQKYERQYPDVLRKVFSTSRLTARIEG